MLPGKACLISVGMHDTATVRVSPLGKLAGGSLGELRRAIEKARRTHKDIAIDLSEVTLLDRHSLSFLVSQSGENVRLINCPEYLEPWVARAKQSPDLICSAATSDCE
jgi:hypothetical protein